MGYGKLFDSAFTGSMVGSSTDVFAVWSYVIAHVQKSYVELNPRLLASLFSSTQERMQSVIDHLCAPDDQSRNHDHEGRRLIKEGEYLYFVTGAERYRSMRDDDERREYFRVKQQEHRARKAVKPSVNGVNRGQPRSTQAYMPLDLNISLGKEDLPTDRLLLPETKNKKSSRFDEFWTEYPRREAKAQALKTWKSKNLDVLADQIIADVKRRKAEHGAWLDGFVPHASTYLNGERWTDEINPKRGNGGTDIAARNRATIEQASREFHAERRTITGECKND